MPRKSPKRTAGSFSRITCASSRRALSASMHIPTS
jgi:hypothetical protein